MHRTLLALPGALVALLVLAPQALARHGVGLYGPSVDDKVITNAGFILIALFPALIALLSLLQWRLEKRKYARMATKKARAGDAQWRGGW